LKGDFNGVESGFAISERENQLESLAVTLRKFKKVLPHFCRVKTGLERRYRFCWGFGDSE